MIHILDPSGIAVELDRTASRAGVRDLLGDCEARSIDGGRLLVFPARRRADWRALPVNLAASGLFGFEVRGRCVVGPHEAFTNEPT